MKSKDKYRSQNFKAIVIGVSAGGLNALRTILTVLPEDYPIPIIIVQHISPDSDNFLAHYLNDICRVKVKEVEEKEEILAGVVYLAPPNYHILVEDDNTLSLSVEARVNFARPAIDVLFESAAYVYGSELVGVVLTGANYDGSKGLKMIKDCGGFAVVQDPETAESKVMPKAAIEAADVDVILPIDRIGPFLANLAGKE